MLAVTLSQPTVSILVGAVLPIIVGLVTKYSASGFLKGLVNLIVSGIAALIVTATVADGSAVISQEMLLNWFITFVTSLATYVGIYGQADVNKNLAPKAGIGPSGGQ